MTGHDPLAIEVSELREALMRLLDGATEQLGPRIDLDADYRAIDPRAPFALAKDRR